jgi:hypothetical protein
VGGELVDRGGGGRWWRLGGMASGWGWGGGAISRIGALMRVRRLLTHGECVALCCSFVSLRRREGSKGLSSGLQKTELLRLPSMQGALIPTKHACAAPHEETSPPIAAVPAARHTGRILPAPGNTPRFDAEVDL